MSYLVNPGHTYEYLGFWCKLRTFALVPLAPMDTEGFGLKQLKRPTSPCIRYPFCTSAAETTYFASQCGQVYFCFQGRPSTLRDLPCLTLLDDSMEKSEIWPETSRLNPWCQGVLRLENQWKTGVFNNWCFPWSICVWNVEVMALDLWPNRSSGWHSMKFKYVQIIVSIYDLRDFWRTIGQMMSMIGMT